MQVKKTPVVLEKWSILGMREIYKQIGTSHYDSLNVAPATVEFYNSKERLYLDKLDRLNLIKETPALSIDADMVRILYAHCLEIIELDKYQNQHQNIPLIMKGMFSSLPRTIAPFGASELIPQFYKEGPPIFPNCESDLLKAISSVHIDDVTRELLTTIMVHSTYETAKDAVKNKLSV